MRSLFSRSFRPATALSAAFLLLAGIAGVQPAQAASGPFADFTGSWSGSGTIRPEGGKAERIRCKATYRPRGSTGHQIDLRLACDSDSYKFDLSGDFTADEGNHISGRWTETTRGIGGTVIGLAKGDRIQIHIESAGFAATLYMVTRNRRQSVTLDSHGGGQVVKGSISLHRS
jgi:hypothetical protein